MATPAPTLTPALAMFPLESMARTMSVTFGVGPAMYSPVELLMLAPEPLLANE